MAVPHTISDRMGLGTGATRTPLPATRGITEECQPQFLRAAEGAQPAWDPKWTPRRRVRRPDTRVRSQERPSRHRSDAWACAGQMPPQQRPDPTPRGSTPWGMCLFVYRGLRGAAATKRPQEKLRKSTSRYSWIFRILGRARSFLLFAGQYPHKVAQRASNNSFEQL